MVQRLKAINFSPQLFLLQRWFQILSLENSPPLHHRHWGTINDMLGKCEAACYLFSTLHPFHPQADVFLTDSKDCAEDFSLTDLNLPLCLTWWHVLTQSSTAWLVSTKQRLFKRAQLTHCYNNDTWRELFKLYGRAYYWFHKVIKEQIKTHWLFQTIKTSGKL